MMNVLCAHFDWDFLSSTYAWILSSLFLIMVHKWTLSIATFLCNSFAVHHITRWLMDIMYVRRYTILTKVCIKVLGVSQRADLLFCQGERLSRTFDLMTSASDGSDLTFPTSLSPLTPRGAYSFSKCLCSLNFLFHCNASSTALDSSLSSGTFSPYS